MQMFVSTNQKTAGTTVNVSLITSSVLQYYSSKVCGFVALEPRCSEDRGDTHEGTVYDYCIGLCWSTKAKCPLIRFRASVCIVCIATKQAVRAVLSSNYYGGV